jgi:hypothetical protein
MSKRFHTKKRSPIKETNNNENFDCLLAKATKFLTKKINPKYKKVILRIALLENKFPLHVRPSKYYYGPGKSFRNLFSFSTALHDF